MSEYEAIEPGGCAPPVLVNPIVEQRHRDAAAKVSPTIVGFGGATGFNHLAQAFARFEASLTPSTAEAMKEACARVAEQHKPDRKRPLGSFDPEDREIIRAEENGEAIAASVIAAAIRALPTPPPASGEKG